MNFKILLYNWEIRFEDGEDVNFTQLLERVIIFEKFTGKSKDYIEQIVKHELTHALLNELGQSQNQFSNGRLEDTFDSEFVCEFVSIYGSYLNQLTKEVIKVIKKEKE